MLTQLKLKNFKAWRKVDFSLGKVTGLFGTNSSGKSSLIQFLLMLKQTKNSPDRSIVLEFGGPGEELVNLGSFSDIAHGHESDSEISWQLTWELKDPLTIYDATKGRRKINSTVLIAITLQFGRILSGSDSLFLLNYSHLSRFAHWLSCRYYGTLTLL